MKRTYFDYVSAFCRSSQLLKEYLNKQSKLGYAVYQITPMENGSIFVCMRQLVSVDEEGHKEALE